MPAPVITTRGASPFNLGAGNSTALSCDKIQALASLLNPSAESQTPVLQPCNRDLTQKDCYRSGGAGLLDGPG
jgi:hypothetical protein